LAVNTVPCNARASEKELQERRFMQEAVACDEVCFAIESFERGYQWLTTMPSGDTLKLPTFVD
jgi:hypothetical protein